MARPALGQYGLPPRARHLPAIGLGRLVVFLYTTLLAHGLKRKIAVIVDGRQRAIEHRNREKREQVRTFRRTESEGRRGEGGARFGPAGFARCDEPLEALKKHLWRRWRRRHFDADWLSQARWGEVGERW